MKCLKLLGNHNLLKLAFSILLTLNTLNTLSTLGTLNTIRMNLIPTIDKLKHTDSGNFFLLAGPCVVESEKNIFEIAEKMVSLTDKYKIPYIFKASYKKANRSRLDSFTGIGNDEALKLLAKVRDHFDIAVVTDIHTNEDAAQAAEYVDVLQIPAFLCRQTDLLIAAAKTGKCVNVKKGQFLAPSAMKFALEKMTESGNENLMITERGTTFGYTDLVVDFRGIPEMSEFGKPVILDITHSLQQPNQNSGLTGGRPELIETIARAGISVGVDGIFIETHPEPGKALSDGANMLSLNKMDALLNNLVQLRQVVLNL